MDKDEWLIVLLGTKQEKGLHIIVDDFYVPREQYRDKAHCRIEDHDPIPLEIFHKVVGALHSHNSMAARFSGGDRANDGLCSTFPMSIVIGSSIGKNDQEGYLLGFEYEAELTYELPCGGLGISNARIIPRGVEDWPFLWEVERPETKGLHVYLGDCSEYKESKDSNTYEYRREAKCGLVETEPNLRSSVFGYNGSRILNALPKPWQPPPPEKKGKKYVDAKVDKEIEYLYYDKEAELMDKWLELARYSDGYEG